MHRLLLILSGIQLAISAVFNVILQTAYILWTRRPSFFQVLGITLIPPVVVLAAITGGGMRAMLEAGNWPAMLLMLCFLVPIWLVVIWGLINLIRGG